MDVGHIDNVPEYLYLHCDICVRFVQVIDLQQKISTSGVHDGKRVIVGECSRCGEECIDSVNSQHELDFVAKRSIAYYLKNKRRREKRRELRSKLLMPRAKKATSRTRSKGTSEKTAKVPTKGKASDKSKAKATATERVRHYDRGENHPTQRVAYCLAMSGGMYTVDEVQERWNSLVKKDQVGKRDSDISLGDLSYMCTAGEIDVNGKVVQVWRTVTDDDDDLFGCPELADSLKSGSRAGKLNHKGDKVTYKGMRLAHKRKDLKA